MEKQLVMPKLQPEMKSGVLSAKDCVMQAVTTVREGADDVYADAKAINDRRAAEAAPEVIEDTASDAE